MNVLINIIISLAPVCVFLIALIFLDSFKLVRLRSLLQTIGIGIGIALICYWITGWVLDHLAVDVGAYRKYFAPVVEEVGKACYLIYLIRTRRIGFMVDAAIFGFAVGAGFALTENVYYLGAMSDAGLLVWIIRGFGTAIMHGGATAMYGIITKGLTDRYSDSHLRAYVPALLLSMLIHSFYNHFLISPLVLTLLILIFLPLTLMAVFKRSEQATREWLGVGMDADIELLNLIMTGNFSESKIGRYLQSLNAHFPPEVIVDMFCLLQIHIELAIRAKGIMMLREAGFRLDVDPEVREKFKELEFLEKSIGPTGKLSIAPFLHQKSRDLWQLYMLGK